MIKVYGAHIL